MAQDPELYRIEVGRRAERFFNRHRELAAEWESLIRPTLCTTPYRSVRISHLKGQYYCSRRWRTGNYRILYDVVEEEMVVRVFDADNRGDVY